MRIVKSALPSPVTAQDKLDVQGAIDALSANASPTFEELRAALSAGKRSRFSDGLIAQTLKELGLQVIG